ncbi:fibroblast growth factor receptor 2-like [Montipora foliosa]|uniref:fibroblast growth factor receptor 2-like n=1 Tax=Montipora foliosa TaxID=591990 RepID=UPI0035F1C504
MADLEVLDELEEPQLRKRKSRKNTPEEKRKQNREWRKRTRQKKKAKEVGNDVPENNEKKPPEQFAAEVVVESMKEKRLVPSASTRRSGNAKRTRLSASTTTNSLDEQRKAFSRSAVMLRMALGEGESANSKLTKLAKLCFVADKALENILHRGISRNESLKRDLKELMPEHLEYLSTHPVGSGSYGQCFHAHYRGIDVIVKQMKYSNNAVDKEKARKNLLHEAEVIAVLGDHASLPMFFGVVTKSLPMCLVTQFHGLKEESTTLHQAASTKNMLTPAKYIAIFLKISSTLRYVHSKGYLHNDIKGNNVVLERTSSLEYNPILIDFGKSTKLGSLQCRQKQNATGSFGKSYLAPEVRRERLYSVASDIFSLARMPKVVSSLIGFYPKVRALVKEATEENLSARQKVAAVKL